MPYTPPAQQSPATSKPASPALSRSHSSISCQSLKSPPPAGNSRPGLQSRSISSSAYLTMRRRSPSASQLAENKTFGAEDINGTTQPIDIDPYRSLRQSPPPVNGSAVPTGAMISPPESSHNSSDDEDASRSRGRQLENLAELQAAIRSIELRKESSPNRNSEESTSQKNGLEIVVPETEKNAATSTGSFRPPLSKEARRISHSRSSTESSIVLDIAQQSQSPLPVEETRLDWNEDDEDSDEISIRRKPMMVRKKSGELVRPALRPASAKKRPLSMPGTPTYSKAVHFDSELEHVRHFLAVDKPLAVSAGSSPVENYDSEIEFPFNADDSTRRKASLVWEINTSNFPSESESRKTLPVRVERVYLSSDNQNLIGVVAVQNLAYNKSVAARFTFDYWKMTSEVSASYNNDVRRKQANDGYDRFNFCIKLADQTNLENKTMFFCVRYDVNGQQFWDNNDSINYQVQFSKQVKTQGQNGTSGFGAALPRSRPNPPMSAGADIRSRSTAQSFDDFAYGLDTYSYGQPATMMMGEPPIKLKKPRTRAEIVPDAPTRRHKATGQAFGNRYDFGASLNAAKQYSPTMPGEKPKPLFHEPSSSKPQPLSKDKATLPNIIVKQPTFAEASRPTVEFSNPGKPAALVSEKPALQSQSYKELVDKYCFFGSAKTSPQLDQSTLGRVDGPKEDKPQDDDEPSISDVSVGSASSSPEGSPQLPESPNQRTTRSMSPVAVRPSSPIPRPGSGLGSRTASPVSFGYPYHQSMNQGLFDHHTPTAIQS